MAMITKLVEDNSFGIIQPVLQHKWQIHFPDLPDDANDIFRQSAIKCKLNIVAQTFEIHIQQPAGVSGVFSAVNALARYGRRIIEVDHMSGYGGISSFILLRGELVDHSYELDYSVCDVATHILKFGNVVLDGDHIPPPEVKPKAKPKKKKK